MEQRFFVTIFAPNKSALADLRRFHLDLFGGVRPEGDTVSIDGLITQTSIEKVREAGFRVEVHQEYVEQSRQTDKRIAAVKTMGHKAWLKEIERKSLCGYEGGYLSGQSINLLISILRVLFPEIWEIIPLERSWQRRSIRALKIGKGSSPTRRGVLLVGGIHARELLNPDALLYFAFRLALAYKHKKTLSLGELSYPYSMIKLIIENIDIFILPLANPDGRAFVLDRINGDRMWRGNRAPNLWSVDCNNDGVPNRAIEVDVNRNFDFVWWRGLGASDDPCAEDQNFKGFSTFTEPESRNIRKLLDSYPHIAAMIDVHSYSEYVVYPWGDDENQTTDPTMNFQNPVWEHSRGTIGDAYKEYIPAADWDWFIETANRMQKTIAAVRGRNYSVLQAIDIYGSGISGASREYSYSRHFVNPANRKVMAFSIESGPRIPGDSIHSFQPLFPEASCIMEDIQGAFMELCVTITCQVDELLDGIMSAAHLVSNMGSASRSARPSRAGNKLVKLLKQNREELLELVRTDPRLWRQTIVALKRVLPIIQSQQKARQRTFDKTLTQRVDTVLGKLGEKGSPKLRRALQSIRQNLHAFAGKTMTDGLRAIDESGWRNQK